MTTLLDQLRDIVGPGGWTTDVADLEPRLREWRGVVFGRTPIMVAPATTAQVAEVVHACAAAGVAPSPRCTTSGLPSSPPSNSPITRSWPS